jgi:hypothetical protein
MPAWARIAIADTWCATVSGRSRASRSRSTSVIWATSRVRALDRYRSAVPGATAENRTAEPPITSPNGGAVERHRDSGVDQHDRHADHDLAAGPHRHSA